MKHDCRCIPVKNGRALIRDTGCLGDRLIPVCWSCFLAFRLMPRAGESARCYAVSSMAGGLLPSDSRSTTPPHPGQQVLQHPGGPQLQLVLGSQQKQEVPTSVVPRPTARPSGPTSISTPRPLRLATSTASTSRSDQSSVRFIKSPPIWFLSVYPRPDPANPERFPNEQMVNGERPLWTRPSHVDGHRVSVRYNGIGTSLVSGGANAPPSATLSPGRRGPEQPSLVI